MDIKPPILACIIIVRTAVLTAVRITVPTGIPRIEKEGTHEIKLPVHLLAE